MHTTLKNAELLKHSKLDKNAPHVSVYIETIFRELNCLIQYTFTQYTIHTPYRVSPILYLFYPICFLLV